MKRRRLGLTGGEARRLFTGRFSANQLHYHRRKNASAFFSGDRAKAAGLTTEKPRTVWMKQMCFADGAPVACKLE